MKRCEFFLLRWVPDVVRGEFRNVGVILREDGVEGAVLVRFARSWRGALALDPGFDADLMNELAAELAQRLCAMVQDSDTRPLLEVVRSSFSNGLQVSDGRGCMAQDLEAAMRRLMRMYVEPPDRGRGAAKEAGRARILRGMREEFTRAGVWPLLRQSIPAAEYTALGDRLRIDCGYRSAAGGDVVRMFQAVSLGNEVDAAKVLAFSAGRLREGVRRIDGAALSLVAVTEDASAATSLAAYRFAVEAMEEAAIRVVTAEQMGELAEAARRELRV